MTVDEINDYIICNESEESIRERVKEAKGDYMKVAESITEESGLYLDSYDDIQEIADNLERGYLFLSEEVEKFVPYIEQFSKNGDYADFLIADESGQSYIDSVWVLFYLSGGYPAMDWSDDVFRRGDLRPLAQEDLYFYNKCYDTVLSALVDNGYLISISPTDERYVWSQKRISEPDLDDDSETDYFVGTRSAKNRSSKYLTWPADRSKTVKTRKPTAKKFRGWKPVLKRRY